MISRVLTAMALAIAALLAPHHASATEDTIIILDASGSMWEKAGNVERIVAARRVLDEVLAKTPDSRRLGLIAYGHRRAGDCGDIEQIGAAGTPRAALKASVAKLSPKGKTPMTAAVKMAAEKSGFTEKPATIVLITDGIETCAPDPCAAAAALEKASIDLKVHVVGLGVSGASEQAQLRCIAESTGGTFYPAESAGALLDAMTKTVVEATAQAPVTNTLTLRATDLSGGPVVTTGLTWSVVHSSGGKPILEQANAGEIDVSAPAGTYDIAVVRTKDGLKGSEKTVTVRAGASKVVTIALEYDLNASVKPDAPSVVAGDTFKVDWTGPNRAGDFLSIAEKDEAAGGYSSYSYTKPASPSAIRAPLEAGTYELRYVLGTPYRVLAKTQLTVTPATANFDAPDTAVAGETLKFSFTGPGGSGDWVSVVKPNDPPTKYNSYWYTKRGSPAEVRMPLEPGDYELRFVQGDKKVLLRQPIKITEQGAAMTAPESAPAGSTIKVEFKGPGGQGDWLSVVKANDPPTKYNAGYWYTKRGSPADVRMPVEPGDYELRFVQGDKHVLLRRPIKVEPVTAELSAPATAQAGSEILVTFKGPGEAGDWITIVKPADPASRYATYFYTRNASPQKLKVPTAAGEYELRFVQWDRAIIARRPITVTP